jgi:hypothetical protein
VVCPLTVNSPRKADNQEAERKSGLPVPMGRKGGRKQSRTLAEKLLRRRIAEDQEKAVTAAFKDFHITYAEALHSKSYKRPRGRIRKDILRTIKIFRIMAAEELHKIGKPKPPKDYVIHWITEERSDAEQERWYHENGTHPLPRRYAKPIYFRETSAYKHYDRLLSLQPNRPVPTAEEIKEAYGSQLDPSKVCDAIADDLKAKYTRRNAS